MIGDAEYLKALSELPGDAMAFDGLCVYFLWRKEELLYIGQSAYLSSRLYHHERARDGLGVGRRIPYDRVTYLEVQFDEMNRVEIDHIEAYSPPYNDNSKPFIRPRYVNTPEPDRE